MLKQLIGGRSRGGQAIKSCFYDGRSDCLFLALFEYR